jgi:hypothetical protein
MQQILQYRLTLGWYSKGVRRKNEETGKMEGRDSDLKIIDDTCKYYDIPSIIDFDSRGVPYVRRYRYQLCNQSTAYSVLNKFNRYYHIDLYQVYKKAMVKSLIYQDKYKDLNLDSVSTAILGEGKFKNLDGLRSKSCQSKNKLIMYHKMPSLS